MLILRALNTEGQGTAEMLPGDKGTGEYLRCTLYTACYHRHLNSDVAPSYHLARADKGE